MQQITTMPAPPKRPENAHKGTFGTVIVVGGCETMIGAPAICGRAAIRSGAGLVKLAIPREIVAACLTLEPCATAIALEDNPDMRVRAIRESDRRENAVLAIGPGLSSDKDARRMVRSLIDLNVPMVIDADGLNHLADMGIKLPHHQQPRILTPHPGEFERLAKPHSITASPIDPEQRIHAAAELAKAHGAVVVLKGHHTVISDGQQYAINETGNPALATGGSGDVLTGLTASLLAQGMTAFDAACLATHLHGAAADRWQQQHGSAGLRSIELTDWLPDTLASCGK